MDTSIPEGQMCEFCHQQESVVELFLPTDDEIGECVVYICLDCAEE